MQISSVARNCAASSRRLVSSETFWRNSLVKIFVAGGTGAIGRPLIAQLIIKKHSVVALTRSPEKAQVLADQSVEPAIADVFDAEAVKVVINRAQPEIVIEQLTALPRTYTRQSIMPPPPSTIVSVWKGAPMCWQPRKQRVCGVT